MAYTDIIASGMTDLFNKIGLDALYGNTSIATKVIFKDYIEIFPTESASKNRTFVFDSKKIADILLNGFTPKKGDSFVCNTVSYTIDEILDLDEWTTKVLLAK